MTAETTDQWLERNGPRILATIAPRPWAVRAAEAIKLAGESAMVITVDQAFDPMIGHLVRALIRSGMEPTLCSTWREVTEVVNNGVVVFGGSEDELALANQARGVIETKRLKLVLWVEDASHLSRSNNDLADWVSHTVVCDAEPLPFLVRNAIIQEEELSWDGEDLPEITRALEAASGSPPVVIDAGLPFGQLLQAVESSRQSWLILGDTVRATRWSGRVEFALRIASRHRRLVFTESDGTYAARIREWRTSPMHHRLVEAVYDLEPGMTVLDPGQQPPWAAIGLDALFLRRAARLHGLTPRRRGRGRSSAADDYEKRHVVDGELVRLALHDGLLDAAAWLAARLDLEPSLRAEIAWRAQSVLQPRQPWVELSDVQRWDGFPTLGANATLLASIAFFVEMGSYERALFTAASDVLEPLDIDADEAQPLHVARLHAAIARGLGPLIRDVVLAYSVARPEDELDQLLASALTGGAKDGIPPRGPAQQIQQAREHRAAHGLGPYYEARVCWAESEVRLKDGAWALALDASQSVVEVFDSLGWGPHPMRARAFLNAGRAHAAQANHESALLAFEKAEQEFVSATKLTRHPLACAARLDRALTLRVLGRADDGDVEAARSEALSVFPYGHPEFVRAENLPRSRNE